MSNETQIIDSQQDVSQEIEPVEEVVDHPRGLPSEHWKAIPLDQREEALDRAAWLVFRGVALEDCLRRALDTMQEDMAGCSPEPTWTLVRRVAQSWTTHTRKPDACYRPGIMELSGLIELMARDETYEPGFNGDPTEVFEAYARRIDPTTCTYLFWERVEELRALVFGEFVVEDHPQSLADVPAIPDAVAAHSMKQDDNPLDIWF